MLKFFYCIIIVHIWAIFTFGQSSIGEAKIKEIISNFNKGNIYQAEILALKALHSDTEYSDEQLFKIHLYLAFCYVAYGDKNKAIMEFLEALQINPEFRLDPQIYSPKIITVYEEAIKEYKNKIEHQDSIKVNNYADHHIKAIKRSLLFPGLGQLYQGERQKGYILAAAEGVSIIGVIYSQWMMELRHDDYLNAIEHKDIEDKYRIYNGYYKARNVFCVLTVGIYLYNLFDCIYFPANGKNDTVSMYFSPTRFTLSLSF